MAHTKCLIMTTYIRLSIHTWLLPLGKSPQAMYLKPLACVSLLGDMLYREASVGEEAVCGNIYIAFCFQYAKRSANSLGKFPRVVEFPILQHLASCPGPFFFLWETTPQAHSPAGAQTAPLQWLGGATQSPWNVSRLTRNQH